MRPQDAGNRSSSVDQGRRTRNPFDVMDVPNPNDREVLEFAAGAKLAGTLDDENAKAWTAATTKKAADVLAFIRARGPTHPRDVEAHFAHGRRINAWGGSGLATTHLLDGMHYRGLLRIQRRDSGTRIYAAVEHPPADADAAARTARAAALLELVVRKYAPLPASSLVYLARLLRYGAPHLQADGFVDRLTERELSSGD